MTDPDAVTDEPTDPDAVTDEPTDPAESTGPTGPAPGALVRASGVTKRFRPSGGDPVTVLDGLDLAVGPGELVVVTGPSLSGKTTLLEVLAGWTPPDAGEVRWEGTTTRAGAPPWWYLSVVPQGFALLEELTVLENIELAARFERPARNGNGNGAGHPGDPGDRDAWLDELLGRLGLAHLRHRGAFEISVGERQRTMVARALADRPSVVLADDPVAHQDQRHASIVLDLLRARVDAGAAGVVATRSPDIAAIADRVVDLTPADD